MVSTLSSLIFSSKTAPTSIVTDAGREIAANMGRIIDQVVQAELVTGTNVIYANDAVNRAALAATDVVTGADLAKATTKLRSLNAKPISMGCYVGIVHSFVAGNIRNTSSGLWLEANKYVTNETILNGETGNSMVFVLWKRLTLLQSRLLLQYTLHTFLVLVLTVWLIGSLWRLTTKQ
jgi:N4-gp56 family major capsid protein